MNRIFVLIAILVCFSTLTFAQKTGEEKEVGFKVNNVFVGGSVVMGYNTTSDNSESGNALVVGVNPEIGYSINNWFDLGIGTNISYTNYRYRVSYDPYRYAYNAINYGIGIFGRLYPLNNFFVQAQPEHNWISVSLKNLDNNLKVRSKTSADCFLVGIGYGQRVVGESSFYTLIMFDVNKDINSPYRDSYGTALPVIRTGFTTYLKSSKKKKKWNED